MSKGFGGTAVPLPVSSYQPKSQHHGAMLKCGNKSATPLSEFSGVFLPETLIAGRQGLIQNEGYNFPDTGRQADFLPVTVIFGVFSESGAICHTRSHVLASVLRCEVSILICT